MMGGMSRSPRDARVAGFLAAEALSAIGSWASLIAIWGYAAFEFDADVGDISLFGIAFALPGIVLGPFAGSVIDRVGPKATLAGAKVVGVIASLLLLTADDFTTLALLSALHGVASTFSHPSIQAMPPRLVADEYLARTNALVSLTDELAIVLGPVAAGVAIAATGFRGAFVLDAITYAVGLIALPLVSLRPVDVGVTEGADGDGKFGDDAPGGDSILDGWRRIIRVPTLRRTVAATMLVHLLYGAALLVEPLYVRDVLGRSETVFASLQTGFGVALVLGGIMVAKLGERLADFGTVAAGVVLSGLSAIVYLGTASLVVAGVGTVLWGLSTALMGGPSRTVIQRSAPESEHGRVLAADFVAGSSTELLAVASVGFLVDAIGLRAAVTVLGLGVAAAGLVLGAADRAQRVASDSDDEHEPVAMPT